MYELGIICLGAMSSFVILLGLRRHFNNFALAVPGARSSHKQATPQIGGIAIAITILSAMVFTDILITNIELTLLAPFILISITGLIDDIKHIPVLPRLCAQTIAGLAIAYLALSTANINIIGYILLLLVFTFIAVWLMNITNFMDGIDLITTAQTLPFFLTIFTACFFIPLPETLYWLSVISIGAILGFVPLNWPVAKIFLGDAGSLLLGLIMAYIGMILLLEGEFLLFILPILYYAFDSGITLLRRFAAGKNIFQAHREHYYQKATRHLSHFQISASIVLLNIVLGGLAITSLFLPLAALMVLLCAAGLLTLLFLRFILNRQKYASQQS